MREALLPERALRSRISKNGKMLAYSGRSRFYLEKTADYEGTAEAVLPAISMCTQGIWRGEWEVTEVLRAGIWDADRHIGGRPDTYKIEEGNLCAVYMQDVKAESVSRLVEAMRIFYGQSGYRNRHRMGCINRFRKIIIYILPDCVCAEVGYVCADDIYKC